VSDEDKAAADLHGKPLPINCTITLQAGKPLKMEQLDTEASRGVSVRVNRSAV